MTSPEQPVASSSRNNNDGCTKYFDALWFCYSPVYQMKRYYVYGTVDDCTEHWHKWYHCLKQKTKFKDEVRAPTQPTHPIWQLRTKEEAQEFWQKEFGHLGAEEEGGEDGDSSSSSARQKTTFC